MLTAGIATFLLPGLCKVSNAFDHIYSDSSSDMNQYKIYYTTIILKLDAGMWRYHANRMDARRSQFDLGRVDAYI